VEGSIKSKSLSQGLNKAEGSIKSKSLSQGLNKAANNTKVKADQEVTTVDVQVERIGLPKAEITEDDQVERTDLLKAETMVDDQAMAEIDQGNTRIQNLKIDRLLKTTTETMAGDPRETEVARIVQESSVPIMATMEIVGGTVLEIGMETAETGIVVIEEEAGAGMTHALEIGTQIGTMGEVVIGVVEEAGVTMETGIVEVGIGMVIGESSLMTDQVIRLLMQSRGWNQYGNDGGWRGGVVPQYVTVQPDPNW
jgi:hypothetical protein